MLDRHCKVMHCRSYIRFRHERDVVFLHRFHEPFCHSITLRTADCRRTGLQIQLSGELPCFMRSVRSSRQPSGCDLSWPVITVIKTGNVTVFQVVIWPVQLNLANKNPADNLPAQPLCCDGGWSPAPEELIMKPGCFFPTSPVLPITVWRKIFHTCLKKMPPAIMKQPSG